MGWKLINALAPSLIVKDEIKICYENSEGKSKSLMMRFSLCIQKNPEIGKLIIFPHRLSSSQMRKNRYGLIYFHPILNKEQKS